MKKLVAAIVVAIPMAGCAKHFAQQDDGTCRGYGVAPGSNAYVNCRMNLANNRQAAVNQASANLAATSAAMLEASRPPPSLNVNVYRY